MGTTSYPVNDAMAVKLWSRVLDHEALKYTAIFPLIGDDEASIIHMQDALSKGPGDAITYAIVMQLAQAGFSENQLAEGNGEQLTTYSDQLVINELMAVAGVKSRRTIDQQRVPWDLRNTAKGRLGDWYAKRYSVSFFNQVCGYTPQTDVRYTGLNPVTAASATRIIRQSNRASDDLLVAGDTWTLDMLDKAKEMAITATPMIRPIKIKGGSNRANGRSDFNNTLEDMYVAYLHPYQVTAMRRNTSTGQFNDLAKYAAMGREETGNKIFSGAIGVYNSVIMRSAIDVTNGVSATGADVPTAKRAVLLGGQAAMMGFGRDNGPNKITWNEELFDHKRRLEISALTIHGIKKTKYNNVDYGTIVMSTYAQPAT
jgi:N4-gp56 family major capsid protein